jgi:hypothetical protein
MKHPCTWRRNPGREIGDSEPAPNFELVAQPACD